jgi:NADH dehydrogenase
MGNPELNVVTGAFGYSGKYITRRLLAMGKQVITLTGNPDRPDPFASQVKAYPFNFNKPVELVPYLKGAVTLYNTYWVRFSYGQINYHNAIQNTHTLLQAAKSAGIQRIVHYGRGIISVLSQ